MNTIEFGKRVKKARKNKKITQTELANAIGKKEVTIRKYENGTIEAPWNVIEEIAEALDVSPFDLTVDTEKLRSEVSLTEQIQAAYGNDSCKLLNDFIELNSTGKEKACDYVSDLAEQDKYRLKPKEPPSAATENGLNDENTHK